MSHNPVRLKVLAVLYTLVLAAVIFLNDYRDTQFLFYIFAGIPYFDKLAHFLVMGFLSFVVNFVFGAKSAKVFGLSYLLGSMIVFTVVTIEELSQILVRGRDFEIADLASDFAGIFVFGEIARFLVKRRKRKEIIAEEI